MDPLAFAAVARARDALAAALQGEIVDDNLAAAEAKRKAFVEFCLHHLAAGVSSPAWDRASPLVRGYLDYQQRAAAGTASELMGPDGANLGAHWLASIAEHSLLDAIARHCLLVAPTVARVLMASGASADVVREGDVKVVRHLDVAKPAVEPVKSGAIVVATQEMVLAGGESFMGRFEQELISAVSRASNRAVLDAVGTIAGSGGLIALPSTGDALRDLRLALQAAEPSRAFVIAAAPGLVAALSTYREAAPGFTVRGGEFRPGIHVVAVDDHVGMTLIPTSRLALWDGGIEVSSARHADVNMADDLNGPAQMVSLWQSGGLGLLAERSFHMGGHATLVSVGAAS